MTTEYENFMKSQISKSTSDVKEESKIFKVDSSLSNKLDTILQKLENIEKHLGIETKTIYDDMKPAYSVKDTAIILGCTTQKVGQYIKYNMLESFRVGYKKMVRSESIKKLIKEHKTG